LPKNSTRARQWPSSGRPLPRSSVFRSRPAFTAIQNRTPVEPWNTDGVPGGAKPWAGGAVTTGAAGAGRGFGYAVHIWARQAGIGEAKGGIAAMHGTMVHAPPWRCGERDGSEKGRCANSGGDDADDVAHDDVAHDDGAHDGGAHGTPAP